MGENKAPGINFAQFDRRTFEIVPVACTYLLSSQNVRSLLYLTKSTFS